MPQDQICHQTAENENLLIRRKDKRKKGKKRIGKREIGNGEKGKKRKGNKNLHAKQSKDEDE